MNDMDKKLSLLSEMILFAKSGKGINSAEYRFLLAVANQLGVSKATLDALIVSPAPYKVLSPESERIVQFHRLVLLMHVDGEINTEELEKLHLFGIRMGLPPDAIKHVLKTMHQYENNIIPPSVLLEIFKTYYN